MFAEILVQFAQPIAFDALALQPLFDCRVSQQVGEGIEQPSIEIHGRRPQQSAGTGLRRRRPHAVTDRQLEDIVKLKLADWGLTLGMMLAEGGAIAAPQSAPSADEADDPQVPEQVGNFNL